MSRRRYARGLLSRVKQIIILKTDRPSEAFASLRRTTISDRFTRVHQKAFDRPSEAAFNVAYWGVVSACLYVYILQYTVTLARDNIHAD